MTRAPEPEFWFATCQVGAEQALKREVSRNWPSLRLAFSRPGFVTFKLPPDHCMDRALDTPCVFARASGYSLGKATGASLEQRVGQVQKLAAGRHFDALHVWQRDTAAPGYRGVEPGLTPAAVAVEAALRDHESLQSEHGTLASVASSGQLVLDCVLVEPDQWWTGFHRAGRVESLYPGGFIEVSLPEDAVSRAYAKMDEALRWSGLPVRPGQLFVEIGCAPGGASQALLDRNWKVLGIDPADVDPYVLSHPNFTHFKKRGADVRRREFRHAKWLAADMNVAPQYTLDTVEAIVAHPEVHVEGLLLTLKLLDWRLAEEIPGYVQRIRNWGFQQVRARQLAHNRRDVCVMALRQPNKSKSLRPHRRED